MFERDLGDGWTMALSGGELVLRHDNRTGGWWQVASVDDDGVFGTEDYQARIPLQVLTAFIEAAREWRKSNA